MDKFIQACLLLTLLFFLVGCEDAPAQPAPVVEEPACEKNCGPEVMPLEPTA